MKSSPTPYKVHFSKNAGWRFEIKKGTGRRVFEGFKTDTQAVRARIHVENLLAGGVKLTELPTSSLLKRIVGTAEEDIGRKEAESLRDLQKAAKLLTGPKTPTTDEELRKYFRGE